MTNKKDELLGYFSQLEFEENSHKYTYKGRKLKYSVSGIIKKFTIPFDVGLMSGLVAKKEGTTQAIIKDRWEKEKDKACSKGNVAHLFGELYPFDRTLEPKDELDPSVIAFWDDLPEHIVPVVMELRMYHKELLFAGTADIILYNTRTETYIIGDYKTNKDLFKTYKDKRLLTPFQSLLDCPYNKYQLQLSFYQILLEQAGVTVSSRKIIWLLPDAKYLIYDADDYTKILKEELLKMNLC